MKSKLSSGSFSDSVLTMSTSYFRKDGSTHIVDKSYTVTMSVELTPAPIDIYVYHDVNDKTDTSCDFKLRKDT